MKKNILIFFILSAVAKGQTVPSSCNAVDSIVKKYQDDADRLAVRRVYKINSTYKDTITISKVTSKTYRDALIAVYNATALTVRDTIIKLYKIHTNPEPELKKVTIKGNPAYQWMQNLQNNITPTGDAGIDYLIARYKLQQIAYYQSQGYDLVIFKADSNLNTLPLARSFTVIAGVSASSPETGYNDTLNITDSINSGFTMLTYSYGWSTCENGCDYRAYWKFKIFPDCSVQYLGRSGDALNTGIQNISRTLSTIQTFPNPVKEHLTITQNNTSVLAYQIFDVRGQLITAWTSALQIQSIDLGKLKEGFYFLHITDGINYRSMKIMKE